MTTPIVALDTETTGLHPGRRAWDIAMIRRDEQGERVMQFFVDVDLSKADPFALNVGRYYERHPHGRYLSGREDLSRAFRPRVIDGQMMLSPADAAEEVCRWTHGAHIIGAVPNFDTEVLASLLRKHGLTPAWHYHLIDVEALAVGYLAGKGGVCELPWTSDTVSQAVGVDPPGDDERHTALGDARWALRLYDRIVGTA